MFLFCLCVVTSTLGAIKSRLFLCQGSLCLILLFLTEVCHIFEMCHITYGIWKWHKSNRQCCLFVYITNWMERHTGSFTGTPTICHLYIFFLLCCIFLSFYYCKKCNYMARIKYLWVKLGCYTVSYILRLVLELLGTLMPSSGLMVNRPYCWLKLYPAALSNLSCYLWNWKKIVMCSFYLWWWVFGGDCLHSDYYILAGLAEYSQQQDDKRETRVLFMYE